MSLLSFFSAYKRQLPQAFLFLLVSVQHGLTHSGLEMQVHRGPSPDSHLGNNGCPGNHTTNKLGRRKQSWHPHAIKTTGCWYDHQTLPLSSQLCCFGSGSQLPSKWFSEAAGSCFQEKSCAKPTVHYKDKIGRQTNVATCW